MTLAPTPKDGLREALARDIADLLFEGGAITPNAFARYLLRPGEALSDLLAQRDAAEARADRFASVAAGCIATVEKLTKELSEMERGKWAAMGLQQGGSVIIRQLEGEIARKDEALTDVLAGWEYIRRHHGDLPGVGWDRAEAKVRAALLLVPETQETGDV